MEKIEYIRQKEDVNLVHDENADYLFQIEDVESVEKDIMNINLFRRGFSHMFHANFWIYKIIFVGDKPIGEETLAYIGERYSPLKVGVENKHTFMTVVPIKDTEAYVLKYKDEKKKFDKLQQKKKKGRRG